MFCKKGVLRNFAKFTGKHLCQSLFLIKSQAWAYNFIKSEALAQVFSFESCKISKNTFSYRTPPLAAFESNFFSEDLPDDSRPDMFYKKGFLKKSLKIHKKTFFLEFILSA